VTQQSKFRFFDFIIITIISPLILAACGGLPTRPGDIEPMNPPPAPVTSQPIPSEPTPVLAETTPESPTAEATVAAEAAVSEVQPDSQATIIDFNISGGTVGFCDKLTVSGGGAYVLQSCQGEEISGALDQADLNVLQTWSNDLAAFQLTFEDKPGQPDNLASNLVFNGTGSAEAEAQQQQVIFDWVNGLFIRLRPQPVAPPPTPTPPEIGPDGLCPDISRPAMVIANSYDTPGSLTIIDPNNQARCDVLLEPAPFGRIRTAAGNLYYPVFDPDTQTLTIWQLSPSGEQSSLTFTAVDMPEFRPFSFALSSDGTKIAWARTTINFNVEPPVYRNDLWVANIDGSGQVTLVDQVENTEKRYLELIRFSPDNSELYYALQPDDLEGSIKISGRYDTVYRLAVPGGQPQLIFACPTTETPICIGDLAPDGNTLVYAQPDAGVVNVIHRDGGLINTLTPPARDYLGPAVFGPTGTLAFVSATLAQTTSDGLPLPSPGHISLIEPPYTGQPRTLLTDNSVATLWEWLDESRLAYGSIDEFGNVGTAIVTSDGQMIELSHNYALAMLR
jgi:hypothetical protein